MFNKAVMEDWLRKRIALPGSGGRCVRLTLRHLTAMKGMGPSIIDEILIPADALAGGESYVQAVLKQIERATESDASNIVGMQTYVVTAEFEQGGNPIIFKFNHGDAAEDDDMRAGRNFGSEPATPNGLQAQLMRHLEATQRGSFGMMGNMMQTLQKENESLRGEVAKMYGERLDMLKEMEEMASMRHVRELESLREQASIKTRETVIDRISTILPVIVYKLTGKPLMGPASPTEAMLDSLLESIQPDQLNGLASGSGLAPEQQIVLLSLFEDFQKRKDARDAKKNAANKSLPASTESIN